MAIISLGDLYDKWKKVADWVTGVDLVSVPKVIRGTKVVALLTAVTTVSTSADVAVGSYTTYSFEAWGSGTYAVQIQAVGPSGTARTLKVWDVLNNAYLTGSVVAAGFYEVGIPNNTSLRANVSAVSGSVNISGGLSQ